MVSKLKKWIIFKFSKELQIVRDFDYVLLFLFYKLIKRLNDNQILICSESRSALSGNLLYIDRKIDKNTYDVFYSLKKDIIEKRTFKQKRMLCRQLATSKYIIIDDFMPVIYPLPLRKKTRLIQVWHAMGAFKKSRLFPAGQTRRTVAALFNAPQLYGRHRFLAEHQSGLRRSLSYSACKRACARYSPQRYLFRQRV